MSTAKQPTGPAEVLSPASTMTAGELPQKIEQQLTVEVNQAPASPTQDKSEPWLKQHTMKIAVAFASLVATLTGSAGFVLGGANETPAVEAPAVEAQTVTDLKAEDRKLQAEIQKLNTRVTELEPLVSAVNIAHAQSLLALEVSVRSHRYLMDLIVDVAQLDHPDYHPPSEGSTLERRLRHSGDILDAAGNPP